MRPMLILLGGGLIACGLINRGWFLLALWLGADFVVLGIAHRLGSHRVFGKRANGTLPLWSWVLFCPLFCYTIAVWHLVRLFSREPAQSMVTENLVVGRRLLPAELQGRFDNYVDLTAEFMEPSALRESAAYCCFPILDTAAPTSEALRKAIACLRSGRTFVHCAQGHGRTGLFAAAVLMETGIAKTAEDALRMLIAVRPSIRLSGEQRACLYKLESCANDAVC